MYMYIVKRGSHRETVTLLGTHVAFGGVGLQRVMWYIQWYMAILNGCRSGVRWRSLNFWFTGQNLKIFK